MQEDEDRSPSAGNQRELQQLQRGSGKESTIRFGLSAIKNVGYNIVELIINERKAKGNYKSMQDFFSRVDSKVSEARNHWRV